ncbi:MAG TPA: hypothetical protein VGD90_01525 [Sphingobacteriaceae bacterium]
MKHLLSANIRGSSFDICIDPDNFSRAHKVFELYQDGKHYQYFYQDNASGDFFTGEDSKLSHQDLEDLYHKLRVHFQQNNPEKSAEI